MNVWRDVCLLVSFSSCHFTTFCSPLLLSSLSHLSWTFFLFAYMYMYIGVCVCTYIHIIHMCIYRYMHISAYTHTVSLKSLRLAAQKRSNWSAQSLHTAQRFSNISTSPVACKLKPNCLPVSLKPTLEAVQDEWCACTCKHVALLTPRLIPPGWLRIVTQIV